MKPYLAFVAALVAPLLPAASTSAPLPAEIACKAGAYALQGGGHLTISASEAGLDYLLPNGEHGSVNLQGGETFIQRPPLAPMILTFTGCGEALQVNGGAPARRIAFAETPLTIPAGDVTLSGKLVLPTRRVEQVAIFVDGSDQTGAVDRTYWQYELPARGVGVLILDKRGTGGSTGQPTANFYLRADDVNAAVRHLRSVVGPKVAIGLVGFSQGGWVAPLAASKQPVDFVMVGYGMAEGVTDEDREEIIQNLREAGFGPADIAQAVELQAAAAAVVKSHWTTGWERLDELKAKYAKAPWIKAMGQDGFTGLMVAAPSSVARQLGPKADLGVSFEYEPAPVIEALKTRQLWVRGGDDHAAPSARTLAISDPSAASQPQPGRHRLSRGRPRHHRDRHEGRRNPCAARSRVPRRGRRVDQDRPRSADARRERAACALVTRA